MGSKPVDRHKITRHIHNILGIYFAFDALRLEENELAR